MRRSEKPPYRVPSMAEIEAIPWNGITVASTFSGCGGSCLGYRMAGAKVAWASEFIPAAQEAYEANHPNCYLDKRDIRDVSPADILEICGQVDLLDGSPPCASFSVSGKRDKDWGQEKEYSGKKQRTDDLFEEFIRILFGLQPRAFIAENVVGLAQGTAKGYFNFVLSELRNCGYAVTAANINSQWLGVPQARPRIVIMGVKGDAPPQPPKPLPYCYSIKDACPWITKGYLRIGDPNTHLNPGSTFPRGVKKSINRPCPTIQQAAVSIGGAIHKMMDYSSGELDERLITIKELRRLCSFPDDFKLFGNHQTQWERLGRAVPPLMMKAIAESVFEAME